MILHAVIDKLIKEREEARKIGLRQSEEDSLYLLKLLLLDAQLNPQSYR
jgi:hypothetical protein